MNFKFLSYRKLLKLYKFSIFSKISSISLILYLLFLGITLFRASQKYCNISFFASCDLAVLL